MGLVRSSSFPLPLEDALRREMHGSDVEETQWVRGRSAARASRCQFTPMVVILACQERAEEAVQWHT